VGKTGHEIGEGYEPIPFERLAVDPAPTQEVHCDEEHYEKDLAC
jgi:RNA polymerase-binding transcription factor DksA